MSTTLVHVDSPETVRLIAKANLVSYSRTQYAASVTVSESRGRETVTYWWAA